MPLLARWPGTIAPGSVDRHLVQNLDFAETFLDLAGVEIPAAMQGRSLVPLLRGEDPADWRRSIYYHYWEFPAVHSVRRHYGVRTDRYKLIHFYEDDVNEWELYDLEKDPREMKSVYADPAYADVVKQMQAELEKLRDQYKDDGTVVNFGRPGNPGPRRGGRAAAAATRAPEKNAADAEGR